MKMFQFQSQYQPGESPYEIFKDRMGAIGSIVEGIKGIIENKYNKGFIDTYLGQVNKAISAQQATDIISMATSDPTDLYDEDKLTETAGQFVDTFNMMGKLAQKESMMGTLSQKGVSPTPKSEVMLPKGDKSQLLNAIMNMPEGQMDFAPILKYMEEHRPGFMGSFSPMEQFALSQAMGQIEDPKAELSKDLDLANKLLDYSKEPQPEPLPAKLQEFNVYAGMYNRKEISRSEFMKLLGGYVAPEKLTDFQKKFNMFVDICEKNDIPIEEDNLFKLFGAYVAPEKPEGTRTTDKVTTTEINLVKEQFSNVKTNAQYDTALAIVRQTDKNVIVPTKEEIFKSNYNKAKTAIMKTAIDINTGKIREGDYKEGLSYIDVYKALFEDLETAIREYQLATSQLLNNPFLSFEEYEKTDVKPREILSSSTWGQQKSIFKDANSYITGETEKGIKGKEDEHGYIIGATYKNEEGVLLKYIGNGKFEEITSSEEGRTRGIK